jgi:hypothetical protein
MVKRAGLLIFSFLLLPALNSAQSNCPQGFVYVGALSGKPQLTAIKDHKNGIPSTRYEFGMRLSCSVHGSPYNQQGGDCDAAVEVCYKPKSDK